ncbi:MAG: hypothetical protein Q7T82_19565 [Armatimonadota bacterium]|nr:hypothetical protein [Armatimonadota bacterium]
MVIAKSSADEVLKISRETLGLSAPSNGMFDDAMLAASLRRGAGILCPCSASTLVASVLESLQYLIEDTADVAERVAAAVESLVIGGDLLELNQVTTDDPAVKGTWLFAAPPGFIVRPAGSIFLVGILPDELTPLPASLNARVAREGFARVLTPQPSEDLPSVLRDLGLLERSESSWLKAPKPESAIDMRNGMLRLLSEQPPSGAVADISLLDPSRNVDYYAGRWISPKSESGDYVGRRPQAYGAPIWGIVRLIDGHVTGFLDFPLRGTLWRGCDVAWHLQMAIDQCHGKPQRYRRRPTSGGVCLDFFSPLPLWAERRLAVLGRPASREKCLFSYWIPDRELASEEAFLQERLWLSPRDKSEQGGGE